jgi:hypothetical protein
MLIFFPGQIELANFVKFVAYENKLNSHVT